MNLVKVTFYFIFLHSGLTKWISVLQNVQTPEYNNYGSVSKGEELFTFKTNFIDLTIIAIQLFT